MVGDAPCVGAGVKVGIAGVGRQAVSQSARIMQSQ